ELEKIAQMTSKEAKEELLNKLASEVQDEAARLIRTRRQEAEEEADQYASKIIATAINRLAVSSVSEATVNTVTIPNDEMKGRIIGKEGRNIRTLEQTT